MRHLSKRRGGGTSAASYQITVPFFHSRMNLRIYSPQRSNADMLVKGGGMQNKDQE